MAGALEHVVDDVFGQQEAGRLATRSLTCIQIQNATCTLTSDGQNTSKVLLPTFCHDYSTILRRYNTKKRVYDTTKSKDADRVYAAALSSDALWENCACANQ